MARTFADEVVQTSQTTGTGTYDLDPTPPGGYRSFRQGYADLDEPYVAVRNNGNTKWELNKPTTLTYGAPDRIARNVYLSTNGNAAVSWTTDDLPLTVYVPASAQLLEMQITGWMATTRHWLLRVGGWWWDSTAGVAVEWVDKFVTGASTDQRRGRYDAVKDAYFADGRRAWIAVGAANQTVAAADVGKVFTFNNAAAARTMTLPAFDDAGVGPGFRVGGFGLTGVGGYGIVVTPDAGDSIEGGTAGASRTVPGGVRFDVMWDDATATWRIIWLNTAPITGGARRQAVVAGPVDGTTGLPNFLPSTNGALSITTQNVAVATPLVATAANGFGLTGPVDLIGVAVANIAWTGLTASRAAATPNFLYGTIAAGVITTASTILAPVYQWGGTPGTAAGQITFNIGEMKAYLGNGSTAPQTNLVLFGEAATDGSGVISTVAYAYNGRYDSGWIAPNLPAAGVNTSKNANLGIPPEFYKAEFMIRNASTEGGYNVGEATDDVNFATTGSQFGKMTISKTRNTIRTTTGNNGYLIINLSTGALFQPAVDKWDHRMTAVRRF